MSVAERAFAPEELDALRGRRPEDVAAAFFSVWTRKEAVVKCLGSGLSFPMRSFALVAAPRDTAERVVLQTSRGLETVWVRPLPGPREGFVAALATAAELATVKCFAWGRPSASPKAAEP
jgi:4'-phosphopantetheinyl transferase